MKNLSRGVIDVFAAIPYLLARPNLLPFLIAPFLIALAILVVLSWWISGNVDAFVSGAMGYVPGFLESIAGPVLKVILWGAFLAFGYIAFLIVASVLTTPFCEILSEKVEEEITGKESSPFSILRMAGELMQGVVHSVRRILVLLASIVGLFILGVLIPVIGSAIALAIGAWFSARFAAYDCFDTIWARKGISYQEKMKFMTGRKGYTTGLGLSVAGLALIPLINTLALPLGSIAATRAYLCEKP